MTISKLKACPFCGGAMQLRYALWPSEGDTDAVIHAAPTECPIEGAFSVGTADDGVTVTEVWNRRAQPSAPEGWVMVPEEPTEAMIVAGHCQIDWCRTHQNTHRPGHPSQKPGGIGTDCGEDVRDAYSAMLAVRPLHPTATHRHKKRGTEYALIGYGKMQAERWVEWQHGETESVDMREVAIYRSVDDGSLWARPREEFEDGRFEALPPAPTAEEV